MHQQGGGLTPPRRAPKDSGDDVPGSGEPAPAGSSTPLPPQRAVSSRSTVVSPAPITPAALPVRPPTLGHTTGALSHPQAPATPPVGRRRGSPAHHDGFHLGYKAGYAAAYAALAEAKPGVAEMFAALQREFPADALVAFHVGRLAAGETGVLVVMQEK